MPIIYENSNASTIDCQSNKKRFDNTPDLVENSAPNVEINAPNVEVDASNFAPVSNKNIDAPNFGSNVEVDAPNFAPVPNMKIGAPNFGSSSNVEIDTPEVTDNEGKLNYNYGNAQFIENLTVKNYS